MESLHLDEIKSKNGRKSTFKTHWIKRDNNVLGHKNRISSVNGANITHNPPLAEYIFCTRTLTLTRSHTHTHRNSCSEHAYIWVSFASFQYSAGHDFSWYCAIKWRRRVFIILIERLKLNDGVKWRTADIKIELGHTT